MKKDIHPEYKEVVFLDTSSEFKFMTKQERVDFIIQKLQEFYPEIPIPLNHKDPYTLLIAVLLSAQCTDVRVNQITPILFAKADNPFDMVDDALSSASNSICFCLQVFD